MNNLEKHLYEAAKKIGKVYLEGDYYKAIDLAKFIIDYEVVQIVGSEKIKRLKAKDGYKKEYKAMKAEYLKPNLEEFKNMLKYANKRIEQQQILGG